MASAGTVEIEVQTKAAAAKDGGQRVTTGFRMEFETMGDKWAVEAPTLEGVKDLYNAVCDAVQPPPQNA